MAQHLNTANNIAEPDDFYEELIAVHDGLTDEQSMKLNAKLILILANHIGDRNVLSEALQCGKNSYQKI